MPLFEVTLSDGSKHMMQAHSKAQLKDALANVVLTKEPQMNLLEQFEQSVQRTRGTHEDYDSFLAAGLGIAGESGEVADLVKKVAFHQHDLIEQKIAEELGDLLWYVQLMCLVIGVPLSAVLEANIIKLQKRYPNGFDPERSKNRESEK